MLVFASVVTLLKAYLNEIQTSFMSQVLLIVEQLQFFMKRALLSRETPNEIDADLFVLKYSSENKTIKGILLIDKYTTFIYLKPSQFE